MKKITLLALAISFGLSGCLNQTLKKANKEYETLRYKDAITHYEKYLAKKDNNDARVNLANSYRSVNRYKDAIDTYAKVINTPGIAPINYLHYARLLMSDNQYPEAKKWIKNTSKPIKEILSQTCCWLPATRLPTGTEIQRYGKSVKSIYRRLPQRLVP